jgi:hypothetical protein
MSFVFRLRHPFRLGSKNKDTFASAEDNEMEYSLKKFLAMTSPIIPNLINPTFFLDDFSP